MGFSPLRMDLVVVKPVSGWARLGTRDSAPENGAPMSNSSITRVRPCFSFLRSGYFGVISFSDSNIELQAATHSSQIYARPGRSEGFAISFSTSSVLLLQKEHLRVFLLLRTLNFLNTGRFYHLWRWTEVAG